MSGFWVEHANCEDHVAKRRRFVLVPNAEATAESEVKADPVSEAQAEAQAEVKAEVKAEAQAEVKAEAQAEAQAEVKAEAQAEVKADAIPEAQAEVKADAQAEVKAESVPETESPPEVKAEPKLECEPWLRVTYLDDALPSILKLIMRDATILARATEILDVLNRYDLRKLSKRYTRDGSHILKAKIFLSMFMKPIDLSSSKYSGLREADLLWHEFIKAPQYLLEFSPLLGYPSGLPHNVGKAPVVCVVNLEKIFIRRYTRMFGVAPTIPKPSKPLPEMYADEWEEEDFVCG